MTNDGGSLDAPPGVARPERAGDAADVSSSASEPSPWLTIAARALPAVFALTAWWKLRQALYHVHWGRGPTLALLVLLSAALLLAVPRVARIVSGAPGLAGGAEGRGARRGTRLRRLALAALVVLSLWGLVDDLATLGANLAEEKPWMLDIGVITWSSALRFVELGQNPYTTPNQPHEVRGRRGAAERDGQVLLFGVPYHYGFCYFPAMFLSYVPFLWLDPGQHSIRIGNLFWLLLQLGGCVWLTSRLVPRGRRALAGALAAALLTTTTGLGDQLFHFGVTDLVVSVYIVLALVALSYRRHLVGGALLGLALGAKLLPAALLVAGYLAWVARRGALAPTLAGFGVVSALVFLPFVLWSPTGFVSATFLFYLNFHAAGDTTSLWYYLPQALRLPFQAAGALIALAVALSPWWSGRDDLRDLVRTMAVGSLVFLASSPMIHLNYQFALVPLACVALAADAMGPSADAREPASPGAPAVRASASAPAPF